MFTTCYRMPIVRTNPMFTDGYHMPANSNYLHERTHTHRVSDQGYDLPAVEGGYRMSGGRHRLPASGNPVPGRRGGVPGLHGITAIADPMPAADRVPEEPHPVLL